MRDYTKYLKHGKKNAVPAAVLAKKAGFANVRKLQEDIAESRAAGQVICSATGGGYYLPKDREEIAEFIRTLESRAKNTFAALKFARKALEEIEGQEKIDLEGCNYGK